MTVQSHKQLPQNQYIDVSGFEPELFALEDMEAIVVFSVWDLAFVKCQWIWKTTMEDLKLHKIVNTCLKKHLQTFWKIGAGEKPVKQIGYKKFWTPLVLLSCPIDVTPKPIFLLLFLHLCECFSRVTPGLGPLPPHCSVRLSPINNYQYDINGSNELLSTYF